MESRKVYLKRRIAEIEMEIIVLSMERKLIIKGGKK